MQYATTRTLARLTEYAAKTSWSEYKQFNSCRAGWFVSNFATTDGPMIPTMQDGLFGLPGVIIQKVFEVIINRRVYSRPELRDGDAFLAWAIKGTSDLYDLIRMDMSEQVRINALVQSHRHYFGKTNEGKARIAAAIAAGMDPVLTEYIRPEFIDAEAFERRYESVAKFKDGLAAAVRTSLAPFASRHWPPARTQSEAYVVATLPTGTQVGGAIDFITSPHSRADLDRRLTTLADGFLITDGKYKVWAKFTDPDQLNWYASIVRLGVRRQPGDLALFDWQAGRVHPVTIDPAFHAKMYTYAEERLRVLEVLKSHLRVPSPTGSIYDLPVEFSPSEDACKFCVIRKTCEARMKAGVDIEPRPAQERYPQQPNGSIITL